jgi:hypothetical protein
MCAWVDNEQSNGVVIARYHSFGALDHQCQDLHPIKLSFKRSGLTLLSSGIRFSGCPLTNFVFP